MSMTIWNCVRKSRKGEEGHFMSALSGIVILIIRVGLMRRAIETITKNNLSSDKRPF